MDLTYSNNLNSAYSPLENNNNYDTTFQNDRYYCPLERNGTESTIDFATQLRDNMVYSLGPEVVNCEVFGPLMHNCAQVLAYLNSTALDQLNFDNCMGEALLISGIRTKFHRRPHTNSPEHKCLQNYVVYLLMNTRHAERLMVASVDDMFVQHPLLLFLDFSSDDFCCLWKFYNIARILIHLVEGDYNNYRRRILEIGVQISEGYEMKRVMGSGAKLLTLVRDKLIIDESDAWAQGRKYI